MRIPPIFIVCVCQLLLAFSARADEFVVVVAEPFIELHTGPGRGYPIFHAVARGDKISVLSRKTTWFKVRTEKGVEGWAALNAMQKTLEPSGVTVAFEEPDLNTFSQRRWETGVQWGSFAGADVLSAYGGYSFTENLSVELGYLQAIGNNSDSELLSLSIVHQMYPQWRVSPFFTLGTGYIKTSPSATLVQSEDRDDNTMNVGFGLKAYITRQFFLRLDYKSYKVLTSRDDNEEIEEWKIGFSVFY